MNTIKTLIAASIVLASGSAMANGYLQDQAANDWKQSAEVTGVANIPAVCGIDYALGEDKEFTIVGKGKFNYATDANVTRVHAFSNTGADVTVKFDGSQDAAELVNLKVAATQPGVDAATSEFSDVALGDIMTMPADAGSYADIHVSGEFTKYDGQLQAGDYQFDYTMSVICE